MGKVLLINKGWSDNIGDQAIKYALEKMIVSHGHICEFADLTKPRSAKKAAGKVGSSGNAAIKRMMGFVPGAIGQIVWLMKYWPIFKKQFRNNHYDLVIIGGGQLINDNASFPLAVFIWMHLLKGLHRNKVVVYGVGSSVALTTIDKMLYRSALKMADAIYLRDRTSLDYVNSAFGIEARYTPDVVFNISKYFKEKPCEDKNVLIAPPCYEVYCGAWKNNGERLTREAYEAYWEETVLENLKGGNRVKLFYTAEQDIPQTLKLQDSMLKNQGMHIELVRMGDIHDYVNELSSTWKVISGRMHALIIALAFEKTLQVFPLSKKLTTFEDEYLKRGADLVMIQQSVTSTFDDMIASHLA